MLDMIRRRFPVFLGRRNISASLHSVTSPLPDTCALSLRLFASFYPQHRAHTFETKIVKRPRHVAVDHSLLIHSEAADFAYEQGFKLESRLAIFAIGSLQFRIFMRAVSQTSKM